MLPNPLWLLVPRTLPNAWSSAFPAVRAAFLWGGSQPPSATCCILSPCPHAGGAAALSQSWDGVRKRVLQECLRQHLLPGLEREARGRLAAQARAVVGQELADRLWEYAAQAPLQVRRWG
mgnify:CR=1 FL=1